MIFLAAAGVVTGAVVVVGVAVTARFSELLAPAAHHAEAEGTTSDERGATSCSAHLLGLYHSK
jgi:hypothetical protein